MSEQSGRHEIATKKVVYTLPDAEAVTVRRDVPFRTSGTETLTMDLHYPSTASPRRPNCSVFTNAAAGRSLDDLPSDLPLFIARAGRDEMPRLNESIDRCGLPTADCRLRTADCGLPTADCRLIK